MSPTSTRSVLYHPGITNCLDVDQVITVYTKNSKKEVVYLKLLVLPTHVMTYKNIENSEYESQEGCRLLKV